MLYAFVVDLCTQVYINDPRNEFLARSNDGLVAFYRTMTLVDLDFFLKRPNWLGMIVTKAKKAR